MNLLWRRSHQNRLNSMIFTQLPSAYFLISSRLALYSCLSSRITSFPPLSSSRPNYHNHFQKVSLTHTQTYVDYKFETLTEMFEKTCQYHPNNHIFGTRTADRYDWMTYAEFAEHVKHTRTLLQQLGIGLNDKVALISNNRWEWAAIAYATMGLGAQIVPMYEAQIESEWRYIAEDSSAKVMIVANEKIFKQVKGYIGSVGKINHILSLDSGNGTDHSFSHSLRQVAAMKVEATPIFPGITADHLATIIYTSGTTGKPKGVELTHGNIASNILGCKRLLQDEFQSNVSLAFLPWAHVFGQVNELHSLLFTGSTLAIVPHRDEILECLEMVKPSVIFSVPVLFNKVYEGIMRAIDKQSFWKRKLIKHALAVARKRNHLLEFQQSIPFYLESEFQLHNRTILRQLREKLGGNIQRMATGGAAAQLHVLHFFEDIGIPIIEGYGLTEAASSATAGTINFKNRRLGCVGVPLPGVTIKIVDPETLEEIHPSAAASAANEVTNGIEPEGEVILSGPIVMKGYHNNALANERVFLTIEGQKYLRTGDLGKLVEGKFLKITGRIREQFKLENGKFVIPTPLEEVYSRGPYISQCFVCGINQPSTALLIVPNYPAISQWARERNRVDILSLIPTELQSVPVASLSLDYFKYLEEQKRKNLQKLFLHEDFILLITEEIVSHGEYIAHYSRPTLWTAIVTPFSQENQQLTVKMSLKRQNIYHDYSSLIDSMYAGKIGHRIHYHHQ